MKAPKLTLYVDTVSPFAYEAYYILRNDPAFKGCEITYIPIFLGGVMKACGNTPPINIKNKSEWIGLERIRWAEYFNVPMKKEMPEGFPPLTLGIMRALCALTALHEGKEGQEKLCACLDEIWREWWVEHRPVHEKSVLGEILKRVLGKEESEIVLEMASKEGKEILAKNTDQALKDGAFGLPWFVATNSKGQKATFWGVDHLAQVASHLELELERPREGGWKALL